jgi:hypothetical protein
MSAIKKQTEPIASAWMIFSKHRSLGNSITHSKAFADFLLRKEQI